MIKKVAFFCKHFGERGTEKTTYDYADFNETILGNKSIIISFSEKLIKKNDYIKSKDFIKKKYFERFKICEINNIIEIREILEKYEITHFYVQSHGFKRDIFQFNNYKIWGECKTIYHCAFGPMARQGSDIRCIVGSYLNRRFYKNLPVLTPIVRPHKNSGDLRKKLKIPKSALVIGRHGGEPGVPPHGPGDVLARHFGELRLGVEEIDVGGASALPQNDYAFGLGGETGKGKPGRTRSQQLVLFEQTGEGGQSNPGGAFAQKTSTGLVLESLVGKWGSHGAGSTRG